MAKTQVLLVTPAVIAVVLLDDIPKTFDLLRVFPDQVVVELWQIGSPACGHFLIPGSYRVQSCLSEVTGMLCFRCIPYTPWKGCLDSDNS